MEFLPALILIFSFITLLFISVPVAWSIAISSLLTIMFSIPLLPSFSTIAQRIATAFDSFTLLAIPFFILSGQIMSSGGIAKKLISFAKSFIGSFPGGLALINIISAMLMGSIAGSALASASAVGGILGSEMEKEGYSKEFSAAVNITSATTGLIIPPSNILIVYSLASGGVSVTALFLAGYIPGILTGLFLLIVAVIWSKKNNYKVGKRNSLYQVSIEFLRALPSLMLLFIVVGGIIFGVFTPTEASAIAVLYSLILSFIYKEISIESLPKVILKSIKTTSVVMLLIGASMCMSWVLSFENIPQDISSFLINLSDNKIIILLSAIFLVYIKIASWRTIVAAVLGLFFTAIVTNILAPFSSNTMLSLPPHYHLVMGSFMFGVVFMATEPVTSAHTNRGKWIYGFLIGILGVIILLLGIYLAGLSERLREIND